MSYGRGIPREGSEERALQQEMTEKSRLSDKKAMR
jgi:hypothetical protein